MELSNKLLLGECKIPNKKLDQALVSLERLKKNGINEPLSSTKNFRIEDKDAYIMLRSACAGRKTKQQD